LPVRPLNRFYIDAMVIVPDHLHAVWMQPVGDCDLKSISANEN
jgi:REP element-mobilizing transposase RayT